MPTRGAMAMLRSSPTEVVDRERQGGDNNNGISHECGLFHLQVLCAGRASKLEETFITLLLEHVCARAMRGN